MQILIRFRRIDFESNERYLGFLNVFQTNFFKNPGIFIGLEQLGPYLHSLRLSGYVIRHLCRQCCCCSTTPSSPERVCQPTPPMSAVLLRTTTLSSPERVCQPTPPISAVLLLLNYTFFASAGMSSDTSVLAIFPYCPSSYTMGHVDSICYHSSFVLIMTIISRHHRPQPFIACSQSLNLSNFDKILHWNRYSLNGK